MTSRQRRIVMDFDGVFIRGDSTAAWLTPRLRSRPALLARSAPWLAGFALTTRAHGAHTRVTHRLMDTAFDGQRAAPLIEELRSFGAGLARDPERTRADAVEETRALLSQGDEVVIASAGMEPLLRAWADELGLAVQIEASRLGEDARGRLRWSDHCFAERKVARLARRGWDRWDLAYTDSLHDLALMRRADEVVLVGVGAGTRRRVARALGATPVRDAGW